MSIVVVNEPDLVVSLRDMKVHLRVEHNDHDTLITSLIRAAMEHFSKMLNMAIGEQRLRWTVSSGDLVSGLLPVPYPPLRSVIAVRYLNDAGVLTAYAPTDYSLTSYAGDSRKWLRFAGTGTALGVAEVEFLAGAEEPPPDVIHAIKMMVARLYAHTGEMVQGNVSEDRAMMSLAHFHRPMFV